MSQWHVARSGATAPTCHTQPPVAIREPHHGPWPLAASWVPHSALETPSSDGTPQGELSRGKSSCQGDVGQIGPSACVGV